MPKSKDELLARIIQLCEIAADSPDSYEGGGLLSPEDYDELQLLVRHLSADLPDKFIELAEDSYSYDGYHQRNIGRRLKRIFEVSKVLPPTANPPEPTELMPTFSLPEADKKHLLTLCTQMREVVYTTRSFDELQKKRLLNRITAIEKQVIKPEGYLDVILAGISDVGEAAGKFGKDVKPLTDRIREIAGIARKNSEQYQGLPSPEEKKLLPAPTGENEEGGSE